MGPPEKMPIWPVQSDCVYSDHAHTYWYGTSTCSVDLVYTVNSH